MQRMFAEPASTPKAAASAAQQPQLGTRPTPVPPWELVLQLGLQTLHRWLTASQTVSLKRLKPGQLDALLCLASMPSTPDSCRCNGQEVEEAKASLSEAQQDLAQLLQQLNADLIAASGAPSPQPRRNWVCCHVVQRVLTTKGLASSKSSEDGAAKLLQIAAHFLLQYTQQAKQYSSSSGDNNLLMLLWTDFIACAHRDQSQPSGIGTLELLKLPR